MSYDLLVFDPTSAPKERPAFLAWFKKLAEWGEGHDYNDGSNSVPTLQAWRRDMLRSFPAMNGPDAVDDSLIEDSSVSDYCCARHGIYVGFAWSVADRAYETALERARSHRLGFYDVSSDSGAVWLPQPDGSYEIAHET